MAKLTFRTTPLALVAACMVLLASFTGCSSASQSGNPPLDQGASETSLAEDTAAEEPAGREITDMAGRQHLVPAEITAVYTTDPVGMIALYTLAPEQMVGLNYAITEQEAAYMLPEITALPVLGMRDSLNTEAVLQSGAQAVIAIGKLDGSAQEDADALQEKLGIPVIMADGSFTALPQTYRFLGAVLDAEDRAELLASYTQSLFDKVDSVEIAEEDLVTFYYGNGVDSLETVLAGSSNNLEFELVGGVNSANIESEALQSGRAQISAEQLLTFMPDVVFLGGDPKRDLTAGNAVQEFMERGEYATIPAVEQGWVYAVPTSPFAWVERPQSANRLMGLLWTAQTLYPDYYGYDLEQEIAGFYALFYHVDLTAEQIQALLSE